MSDTTRRAVLAGAVGVTATAALAACGDDDSGSSSTGNSSAGGVLAKKSDIPVGGGKVVSDGGGVVIVQPESGTFKAFSAICTHQQCVVTSIADNAINCKCHGSVFSAKDGSVTKGPATTALAEKTLKIDGDSISLA